MKNIIFLINILLLTFCKAECITVDKIVAIVNNSVILKSEIDNLKKLVKLNNFHLKNENINDSDLYKMLLNQLIIDEISYEIAIKNDILIDDLYVEKFIEKLAIQSSISKDNFINKIISNNIDIEFYKNFIKKKITNNILYEKEIKSNINVSNDEILSLGKNIDSNKILNLFVSYDFCKIIIPFSINSELNYVKNKNVIENILYMLKSDVSINKINNFINLTNKDIKIKEYKNIKLKDIDNFYANYFNNIYKKFVIDPIYIDNKTFLIKIDKVNKPDFSKLINEINISNIFIKNNNLINLDKNKDYVNFIYKNILENKISFSEAAKKYSNDDSSNNGGNIGWSIIDYYDKVFINKIKKLKKGEISKPFLYNKGWNIIKLIDVRSTKYNELIIKQYLYEYIFNKKFSELLNEWINNNKKNSYIKIYD